MQNFSAQEITYANYKEKLDMVLKNCKQNEIILKNQQRRSISRSNSREKSLNAKPKQQPAPIQKQLPANPSHGGSMQQPQGSKKNLTRSRNLSITTSYDKKQSNTQSSNSKIQGNSTCTNTKATQNYLSVGPQSVQSKSVTKKNPSSCKNQSNTLQKNNSVSNNNNNNNNIIQNHNASNQNANHQNSNSLTPGIGGEQYHNFSSFFSSQSTKNNINNNLLNNSIQGIPQPQKNNDKITLFLQHLQSSDSPMKQILQIQDKLQSYHQSNVTPSSNIAGNQQNLNNSMNSQTLNLNNSYCTNTTNNNNAVAQQQLQQFQQALHQRQRFNSNDCVFNINQSSITAGGQLEQFDPYRASFSQQESQFNELNTSIQKQQQQQQVAQVNVKLNLQSKSKQVQQSPQYNTYVQKKNVFSMHSSTSSADPQKCLLNQFDDHHQFTPSSAMVPQGKYIDLNGANIQISDIILDKKMNINELSSEVSSQQHTQFLKEKVQQLKDNSYSQQNNSENYDIMSNNQDDCNEILAASMPINCHLGSCNPDDEYLRTPKQIYFSEISKSQQLPYQHTPITHTLNKQNFQMNAKVDEKMRSKSYTEKEYQSEMVSQTQQQQDKILQKRRALTIADDSYVVLQNEDDSDANQLYDSMQVNHTYHNDEGNKLNKFANIKVAIPKIKNFDQMIEEKNQQMDYEIPPHIYNETFQGEEYSSSQATSEMRSENHDSMNQTQNIENNLNQDSISMHPSLKSNPMQGYRNMMKAMEISGKDNDAEIKALKITIRKLQYRDAVLRQKIAKMASQSSEQQETIQKLDAENNELINQVNAYAEQHEIYQQQINQLQFEMQQFQVQVQDMQLKSQNQNNDQELTLQIAQYEEVLVKLKQQLVQQEQTAEELREQIQEYSAEEEILKEQLGQRDEEIQKQQYDFLEKLAEFQEENIRVNQLLKSQQSEVVSNQEMQVLTKQINDLNSENEKLYEQITSLLKENEQYKQQKDVVSNVNDLSIKSLKLLDDNSKLIDENRALQANIIILTKDNKQLKDGVVQLQHQIQHLDSQPTSSQQFEENKYKQMLDESIKTINDLKQVNQELINNISHLESKNQDLNAHCSALELKMGSQIESIRQLSGKQSKENSPKEQSLMEQISHLQKEIVAEKEKSETLEKKIIQISQKTSLNQSIQSKQEYHSEEIVRMKQENDELRKELDEQFKEKECLEEVLKNYLLQRELEKLKLSGDQKILKDQEQDDEIAEAFQSDSKINGFLSSQQKTNMDLNSQLLNYFSNSNQNKQNVTNQNQTENYHMFKRNSNCTITNGNNTNYQISITEDSQLSLLEEDGRCRINEDDEMEHNEELAEKYNRLQMANNNNGLQNQDQQNLSNLNLLVSTNTNCNNNNFNNNNNNTIHSNNLLKKSSASSSHFLREIDSNIQILINNNSNNTLLNNIQHLLNTSSSSNILSKENTNNNNMNNHNNNNNTNTNYNSNTNNISNNTANNYQTITTSMHLQHAQANSAPSSNNHLQNLSSAQVLSSNSHPQNLSHQNLSTKLGIYQHTQHTQKSKENDNPINTSGSAQTATTAQPHIPQQYKGFSDHKISNNQQQLLLNQGKQLAQNKENQTVKAQFIPHSMITQSSNK